MFWSWFFGILLIGYIILHTFTFLLFLYMSLVDRENFWATFFVGITPILSEVLLFSSGEVLEILGEIRYKFIKLTRRIFKDRHYKVSREMILILDPLKEEDWNE